MCKCLIRALFLKPLKFCIYQVHNTTTMSTASESLTDKSSNCSSRRGSFTPTPAKTTTPPSLVPGSVTSGISGKVTDLRLILVNFVVAGLEIASSVAFTFIPPLLLKSGYSETQMSIIFGVGKCSILVLVSIGYSRLTGFLTAHPYLKP